MPKQKIDAPSDRRRSLLAAWHLESGTFVPLGKDLANEQVTPIRRTSLGYVAEWSKYAMNRTIGRPAADLSLVDLATGARTPLRANINDRFVQAGPAGRYLLFIEGDQYWTINLATRAIANITKAVPTSFIDKESDQTSPQKPPFGVAGWTRDDGAVLLNDKYDVWLVAERRIEGRAADQRRGRAGEASPRPARSRRGVDRPGEADLPEPVRRVDEEVGLRAPRPVGRGDTAGLAGQERRLAGEGEAGRRVRIHRAGLRRFAGPVRRPRRT